MRSVINEGDYRPSFLFKKFLVDSEFDDQLIYGEISPTYSLVGLFGFEQRERYFFECSDDLKDANLLKEELLSLIDELQYLLDQVRNYRIREKGFVKPFDRRNFLSTNTGSKRYFHSQLDRCGGFSLMLLSAQNPEMQFEICADLNSPIQAPVLENKLQNLLNYLHPIFDFMNKNFDVEYFES